MKTFAPDSSIASDVIPSANYGDRNKGRQPDMILLHYTGMPDVEGAIAHTAAAAHFGRVCAPCITRPKGARPALTLVKS